jgi:hypothetical protein
MKSRFLGIQFVPLIIDVLFPDGSSPTHISQIFALDVGK